MSVLTDLIQKTNAVAGRSYSETPEYHFTCPNCGHPSSPRNPHCSFSERGWHCFSCGGGGTLAGLAAKYSIAGSEQPVYTPKPEQPATRSWWMSSKGEDMIAKAAAHPNRDEIWQNYKKLPVEMLNENKLGVGVLPASACQHERLIVPVYDGTMLVGIRGRQFCCDCKGKWLAPQGTRLEWMPLFGERYLKPKKYIWLVENMIDALQITAYIPESIGLAIYSTSYWIETWAQTLKKFEPQCVIIALDNDLVGNGGDQRREEFIKEWLKTHQRYPTVPAAVKIGNMLNEEHIPVSIYKWGNAPFKADVGTILKEYAV